MKLANFTLHISIIAITAAYFLTPAARSQSATSNNVVNADTHSALLRKAYKEEKDFIDHVLSTNITASTSYADMKARWPKLQKDMIAMGATPKEAKAVLAVARRHVLIKRSGMPEPHWPIAVKRGWINERPKYINGWRVWIFVLAWPRVSSAADRPDAPKWNCQFMVINPRKLDHVHAWSWSYGSWNEWYMGFCTDPGS